ncbi:MAG: septum formation initiator family protein [Myxococcota bacterium]
MHWVNRILVALLIAGALAFWPERLELAADSEDLERVRREHAALSETNAKLRDEIRLIAAEISALQHDPREVARIAREDLNLVRPGEFVFEVEHVPAPGTP